MTPWPTTIAKVATTDGNWRLDQGQSPYKVGQTIEVDLDSRRVEEFEKTSTGAPFKTEVVNLVDPLNPQGPPMWFPVEMLDL